MQGLTRSVWHLKAYIETSDTGLDWVEPLIQDERGHLLVPTNISACNVTFEM